MLKSLLALFTAFSFILINAQAQTQQPQGNGHKPSGDPIGIIRGHIFDEKIKQPIEFASIAVYGQPDSTLKTGAVTDSKGKFEITGLSFGKYFVIINFIGFKPDTIRDVTIRPDHVEADLGEIAIHLELMTIGEVTISGNKEVLEYNLDKKVINVGKDITATGGTALDVMKNVPSLSVDMDNNLTLRGSSVNILVDGKPSTMDPALLLEQLPADMIDKIEVVTNPSASHEAEGMGGIINIVTKKNKKQGVNGIFSATIATWNKYTGTVNLNYRNKKVNYFLAFDGRYTQRDNAGDVHKEFYNGNTLQYSDQNSDGTMKGPGYSGKAGADISLTDRAFLSLTGNLRYGFQKREDETNYLDREVNDSIIYQYSRNNSKDDETLNYDFSANFKKTFKIKGEEWTGDAFYSSTNSQDNLDAIQHYDIYNYSSAPVNDNYERTDQETKGSKVTLQSDYILPLEKIGRFETGIKGSYQLTNDSLRFEDFDHATAEWTDATNRSNHFRYEETILAAYLIYGNAWKKFRYQAGLRYEGTLTDYYLYTTIENFDNDYHQVFPSVHLKYSLKRDNELSLSYGKRINRPNVRALNPLPDYSDPQNLRIGNPNLQPEIVHSVEFAHSKSWKKLSLNTTLFYRKTNDAIARYRAVDTSGVSISTSLNLTESHSFGAEEVLTMNLFPWWRFNASFSYFRLIQQERADLQIPRNDNYNFNTRFTTTFTVWKNMDIQLSGYYRSKAVSTQGYMKPIYSFDLGIKKEVLKGKGAVSLSLSDIFNTQRYITVTDATDYYVESEWKRESRVLTLGFTYKLNNDASRKDKKRTDDSPGGDMDFEGN